jgi:hypothetical protein
MASAGPNNLVAMCEAPGTAAATTTAMAVASSFPTGQSVVLAECDGSGGDVAAWAQLREAPGWATAVTDSDRSSTALFTHVQQLPSGLRVLVAPTRPKVAGPALREAAARFGPVLASLPDVVTVADCGRTAGDPSPWLGLAALVVLLVRQSSSAGATVARVDRAGELFERLQASNGAAGVVVVGAHPYPPAEVAAAVGGDLWGVLPEDPVGAGLVAGAWTLGRGAARCGLARAARPLAVGLLDRLSGPAGEPAGEAGVAAG